MFRTLPFSTARHYLKHDALAGCLCISDQPYRPHGAVRQAQERWLLLLETSNLLEIMGQPRHPT
jgi:hypothetical protein